MSKRKGQRRIEVWVTEDEFMVIGKYAGKGRISEVIRGFINKLRRKSEITLSTDGLTGQTKGSSM